MDKKDYIEKILSTLVFLNFSALVITVFDSNFHKTSSLGDKFYLD